MIVRTVGWPEFLENWPNIDNPEGHPIFLDLGLFDIPATITAAVRNLAGQGVYLLSVANLPQVIEAAEAGRIDGWPQICCKPLRPFSTGEKG